MKEEEKRILIFATQFQLSRTAARHRASHQCLDRARSREGRPTPGYRSRRPFFRLHHRTDSHHGRFHAATAQARRTALSRMSLLSRSGGPSSRTKQRCIQPAEGATKEREKGKEKGKNEEGGLLAFIGLVGGVIVMISLAVVAGKTLYNSNPGEFFKPKANAVWQAVPGVEEPWEVDFSADTEKRDAVHAWQAYSRDAFGSDEYHPLSRRGSNLTSAGGIGYTVIDAIDTMLVMGLDTEYRQARRWVAEKLDFDKNGEVSTFETTIRVLGGLLSAYALSPSEDDKKLFLARATDLGERMLPVFNSPSGLPYSFVNLAERKGKPEPGLGMLVSTAEAASLQLEFRYLAHLTDRGEFWDRVEKVMDVIRAARVGDALVPIFMSMPAGKFMNAEIRLGSRGDSYYEYLLKQYIQTDRIEEMYAAAMDAIHRNLFFRSNDKKLLFAAEIHPRPEARPRTYVRIRKQDHLVCFLGGSLLLGAVNAHAPQLTVSIPPMAQELTPFGKRDWSAGMDLVESCVDTYRTPSGLAPEIVHVRETIEKGDWFIKGAKPVGEPPVYDARYILRYATLLIVRQPAHPSPSPETVESLFIAWRLTGHPKFRDYGWEIFQAIEKHCRIPDGGYAGVLNVEAVPVEWEDKQETFFLSETLKYLYLLFSDDSVIPLDEFVFNTEAHPLPIFSPNRMHAG
ncbi:unnamed protein product [Mycena citricolor]|uniref:alpha-1,2-Mannosidase n=1 Tax=Mycena citricolor TaxID=2018698 RepID=A0AAD2I050_9AGAR|nr:unnamed protein product [Mycena citricolor]